MPAALTTASVLQCSHNGRMLVNASQRLLTVDGQPVLVEADLTAASFTPCLNTGPGRTPCSKILTIAAGLSTVLRAGEAAVVLANATGTTNSAPNPGTWSVTSVGHSKLEAGR